MKRIFLILALSLISVGISAKEHLSFKGIPIEGSMSSFCQKLKDKGYSELVSDTKRAIFTGNFASKEVIIVVRATDDGQNVFSVSIHFDESEVWKDLVSTYSHFKDLYSRKYGEPADSQENNPSRSDNNMMLMYELTQGNANYDSLWVVPGGKISLHIIGKPNSYGKGMVGIIYTDNLGREAKIQNDIDDI